MRIRDNDTGPHFTSTNDDTVQDIGMLIFQNSQADPGTACCFYRVVSR